MSSSVRTGRPFTPAVSLWDQRSARSSETASWMRGTGQWTSGQRAKGENQHTISLWGKLEKVIIVYFGTVINNHTIFYYETFVTCHRLITLASFYISNKRSSLQLKQVYQTASFDALLISDYLDFWVLGQTDVMSKDDMLGIAHFCITSRFNG